MKIVTSGNSLAKVLSLTQGTFPKDTTSKALIKRRKQIELKKSVQLKRAW